MTVSSAAYVEQDGRSWQGIGAAHEGHLSSLHRLAEAYQSEGLTEDERTGNILEQFRNMPYLARRALIADLATVALSTPDLYPLAIAANGSEAKPSKDVA